MCVCGFGWVFLRSLCVLCIDISIVIVSNSSSATPHYTHTYTHTQSHTMHCVSYVQIQNHHRDSSSRRTAYPSLKHYNITIILLVFSTHFASRSHSVNMWFVWFSPREKHAQTLTTTNINNTTTLISPRDHHLVNKSRPIHCLSSWTLSVSVLCVCFLYVSRCHYI